MGGYSFIRENITLFKEIFGSAGDIGVWEECSGAWWEFRDSIDVG